MSPKISIIIPSYNEEKNISRCLDSVMNQTFSDFEIIIVNDGSTDAATNALPEKYSRPKATVIHTENEVSAKTKRTR